MSQPGEAETEVSPAPNEKQGIGGWLLVLCVGLTILSPLATLYSVAASWRAASPLFEKVQGLESILVMNTAMDFILTAWACYVGVQLWRVKEGAVQAVRGFLTALPLLRGLMFLFVLASPVYGFGFAAFIALVQALIFAAIWKSYLTNSKRVKATFAAVPTEPASLQAEAQ